MPGGSGGHFIGLENNAEVEKGSAWGSAHVPHKDEGVVSEARE